MRTEILLADEMPDMTAEHRRRAIHAVYEAYENDDRDALEQVIAEDFSFTSPYDNAIDREEYFQRCWPNHKTPASMMLERIVIDGDGAYITYVGTNTSGRSFRNTEYMTFRNGKIASVDVFFGPGIAMARCCRRKFAIRTAPTDNTPQQNAILS